VFQKKFDKK